MLAAEDPGRRLPDPSHAPTDPGGADGDAVFCGRLAVYDTPSAAPRVEDVVCDSADSFIEELSGRTYSTAREHGGSVPYTVIREIVENLIHADFREPVVSILDSGDTVRFSDQGPGIPDKDRAVLPGYTTATARMKRFIRGVGSGLPLVSEFLGHENGALSVEDNLGSGTVVTLSLSHGRAPGPRPRATVSSASPTPVRAEQLASNAGDGDLPAASELPFSYSHLSNRQKRVLSLVMECGEAGPTLVSKELSVGLSTAYRDLAFLEEQGLIFSDESGKREITPEGTAYLDSLFG